MKYAKKADEVEAVTFDQLVQYGRDNGANIVNGMPWSFEYCDNPVTHENDECYLVHSVTQSLKVTPDDMLIIGIYGEAYTQKVHIFQKLHTPIATDE